MGWISDDEAAELRRQHAEIESLRSQLAEAATEIRAEQERRRAEIRAQLEARVPDDNTIRSVFMAHGFTIKDGQTDLKPYVFEAARALLSAAPSQQAPHPGSQAEYEQWSRDGSPIPDTQQAPVQGEPVGFVVSVVVIKDTPTGFNTQNKLYPLSAVSDHEARGKALELAGVDFPEHHLHTICSYQVQQQASKPMTDEIESALEALVNRCNNDAGLTNDGAVIAAEAALERLYKARAVERHHKIGEKQ
jgi:hypothetical protein